MSDLDRFRTLMLEHLYGLLDADEERELDAYLATPDGAGLRVEAEAWKAKLGRAAVVPFPVEPFEPPTATPARPAPARTTPPLTIRAIGTRWAVAACLLVVLAGLGGPAAHQAIGWIAQSSETDSLRVAMNARRNDLKQAETDLAARKAQIKQEHDQAVAARKAVESAYREALANAKASIDGKDFLVRLTGPERAVPGAPNEWKVETLDRHGRPTLPRKMEFVVKDQANTELARETFDRPPGPPSLKLTTGFWEKVKPGSDLFLEVVAYTDDNRKSVLAERVPLARPVYVTHLVTDKPLYRPGEVVQFRSLTLDRSTFLPPDRDLHLQFRLKKPDGALVPDATIDGSGRVMRGLNPVMGPDGKPVRGLGVGEYRLPENFPGGEYTLEVVELVDGGPNGGVVLDTRRFLVNNYIPDTFEKRLEFDGKSYGPGDVVQARVEVTRTAGGPMKDALADVVVTLNGNRTPIHVEKNARFQIVTDPANGQAKAILNIRFKLPADLNENRAKDKPATATLTVTVRDGSDIETILRPIPLVEKELLVEYFPEGGDLVAGVPSRVYFQVRTPSGKPADLKGSLTDGTNSVAEVATLTDPEQPGVNRGLGVFTFTPQAGKKYFLKLKFPAGIVEPTPNGFALPEIKADGVVLTALDAVTEAGGPIRIKLESSNGPKVLHVGAYARGRLIGHQRVELAAGKPAKVALAGDPAAAGVTRVTVFEETSVGDGNRANLVPRAERLVFRRPAEQLRLNVTPDKVRYGPGGRVVLDIAATDEKDRPAPAILYVAVVNQSVIAMADNKTDRLLPTHFLLAGEVRNPAELEHADFLLTDHPMAGVALDLLLGTQGWRRFAEQNVLPADPTQRQEVERMLVAHGQRPAAALELARLEEKRVAAEFQPKLEQAAGRVVDADAAADRYRTQQEPALTAAVTTAKGRATSAEQEHEKSAAELYKFETRAERVRGWALPLFMLGLIALAVGGLAMAVQRSGRERRRYVLGTVGAGALALLVLGGILLTHSTTETERAFVNQERANEARYTQQFGPKAKVQQVPGPGEDGPIRPVVEKKEGPVPPPPKPRPRTVTPKMAAENDRQAELAHKAAGRPRAKPAPEPKGDIYAQRDALEKKVQRAAEARPGQEPLPVGPVPFVVREYAHQRDPALGAAREDHTETVFWHPVLVLPADGRTQVEFQLSDDIARYQVLVAGHTLDGRIGAVTKTIEARKPLTVDPKLPTEISSADAVDVPIRVVNDSDERRAIRLKVGPKNLTIEGPGERTADGIVKDTLELGPNGKGRKIYRVRPTGPAGKVTLAVLGSSDTADEPDSIVGSMRVVPDGFPVSGSFSDLLEKRAIGAIEVPKDLVKGTLKVRLEVYPTSLADLVKGLDGLLREPGGCFEQSSSASYPNTLILDYLNQTNQADPEAAKKAKELLDRGYARLVSFECPDTPTKSKQGFEWFGAPDMPHEALTAYGLLQFKDMARVSAVDPDLIKRTQAFLISRRDGQGGFKTSGRAIDSFGRAPKHTTDAYIVWALVESDPDNAEKSDLAKEIAALKAEAINTDSRGGKDAYFVALVANVLVLRGDRETAITLLDRLRDKHMKDGAITGAETSVTRSGGRDLQIETTALAALGWLRANDARYAAAVRAATRWMVQRRAGAGGFGSTQSTILALKALTLHARTHAHPPEAGEVRLLVAGKPVASKRFSEHDTDVISLDVSNPEGIFPAGARTDVEVVTDAKNPYPFTLSVSGTALTPPSSEQCEVRLETRLARAEAAEGEAVPLTVTLENLRKMGQGMAVAVVGLPAGMKVPTDMKQLTDLREKGLISFFEVRGRELILYWREMAPEQKITLNVDLVCDIPGEYRGPASRAYLYYAADHKDWVGPLAVKIRPAGPEGSVAQK
jgi:hypothetical protein